jgi:hypothetical protein
VRQDGTFDGVVDGFADLFGEEPDILETWGDDGEGSCSKRSLM